MNPFKWPQTHEHQFLDKLDDRLAVWQKRECPGGDVYFRGKLRECTGCGAQRFKVKGLREVDCSR